MYSQLTKYIGIKYSLKIYKWRFFSPGFSTAIRMHECSEINQTAREWTNQEYPTTLKLEI